MPPGPNIEPPLPLTTDRYSPGSSGSRLVECVTKYKYKYKANLYSAVSRKRIGGAWRQCLDRLCGSVCRGKELRL